ncbi:MAG: DUF1385 domain-containing protein [Archangiaceae bacterium]|nr:DUF1385 domain-containing protein [Archangiaceae bacterium]
MSGEPGLPGARPYIGGQAVIEGVMMRSPKSFVVAVRRPDGTIAIREQPWETLMSGLKFLRWPLFRGALVLLESMHNGYSALNFSAEHGVPPEDGEAPKASSKGSSFVLTVATLFAVGLFIAVPHLLTWGLSKFVGPSMDTSGPWFHLVDGIIRIGVLVGYMAALSKTKDAQRLFQYHGAEHRAIWTYESGKPLTVENARGFTTQHPRCGTSFLFIVVFVAVLVHIALIPLVPRMAANDLVNNLLLVLVKVPMALPIAGIAYELQRLSAKESCPSWVKLLVRPGIWLQGITTKEPSDDQQEIALLALERALAREQGAPKAVEGVTIYPSFELAKAA